MKPRYLILLLSVVLLLLAAGLTFAQDSGGDEPLLPDNLCDEGELWGDGRCNIPQYEGATELAWECGWYMARVLYHGWSIDQVPDECDHLLASGTFEICRTFEEEPERGERISEEDVFTFTICLRADQTGTESVSDGFVVQFRFLAEWPTGPDMCPIVDGFRPAFPGETSEFEGLFSADELYAQLGLLPYFCGYFSDSLASPAAAAGW